MGAVGADVDRLGVALEEDAVARVEHGQVELGLGGGAEQGEEVLEHLGHEVPRGAGVEAEPVALDAADAAAEVVVLLEQVDAVAARGEQRGGGQARRCRRRRRRRAAATVTGAAGVG